jgi:hypothetical protein
MLLLRTIAARGLLVGLLILLVGLVMTGGSALAAGDWWLARQPWIGFGLALVVAGLALTGAFALLLDWVAPVGRLRLLAVPPALIIGSMWAFWLVVGLPTSGHGGPERDIATMLYSLPQMLLLAVVATLLLILPVVVERLRHGGLRRR